MFKHLNTYSILELLMKLVTEVEEACGRGDEFEWLYDIDIVSKLLGKLDKDVDAEVHANSSAALVGFVSCGAPIIFGRNSSVSWRLGDDLLRAQ